MEKTYFNQRDFYWDCVFTGTTGAWLHPVEAQTEGLSCSANTVLFTACADIV